jgi:hypothetical protein
LLAPIFLPKSLIPGNPDKFGLLDSHFVWLACWRLAFFLAGYTIRRESVLALWALWFSLPYVQPSGILTESAGQSVMRQEPNRWLDKVSR